MKIAILGSTSEIAQDLIPQLSEHKLYLYQRDAAGFFNYTYDAIINFVGAGDPDKVKELSTDIFDITDKYDTAALSYVKRRNKQCKYIFMSSGAAADPQTPYGYAKLRAECRHRGYADLSIVDVRIYSYFSHTQRSNSGFFMSDVVKALETGTTLKTSLSNMTRDYASPDDVCSMVDAILLGAPMNVHTDLYTLGPADKFEILEEVGKVFGLRYSITNKMLGIGNYYCGKPPSVFRKYKPKRNSIENIIHELKLRFPK